MIRRDREKRWLFSVLFVDGVGAGILIPVLPFIALSFGVSAFDVTLLVSAFAGLAVVGSYLIGKLGDHVNKPMLLSACLLLMTAGYGGMALASSFGVLLLMRCVSGFSAGNSAVVQSLLAELSKPEDRPRVLGQAGGAIAAGILVGPLLVSLMSILPTSITITNLALFLAIAFAAVAFVLSLFLVSELKMVRSEGVQENPQLQQSGSISSSDLKKYKSVSLGLVVFFLGSFAFSAALSITPIWTNKMFQWTPLAVGCAFALATASLAITQALLFPWLVAKYGLMRVFSLAPILIFITLFLVPACHSEMVIFIAYIFTSAGFGILSAGAPSFVSMSIPASERGTWLGISESARAGGQCLGPLAAGLAYDYLQPDAAFYQGAIIALVATIVAFLGLYRLGAPDLVIGEEPAALT